MKNIKLTLLTTTILLSGQAFAEEVKVGHAGAAIVEPDVTVQADGFSFEYETAKASAEDVAKKLANPVCRDDISTYSGKLSTQYGVR